MSERLQIHKCSNSTTCPLISNQSKLFDKNCKSLVSQPPLVQAKLTINQPGDEYEQEANRITEKVMRMPDYGLQPKCAMCDEDEKKTLQGKRTSGQVAGVNNQDIPSIVNEVLRSPGEPLDKDIRAFMEPRFGHDFSQVRVHTDERAAESARAVNALAYTVGRDIVSGTGRYDPGNTGGQKLLAHELAHTIQQSQESYRSAQMSNSVHNSGNSYKVETETHKEVQTISPAYVQGRPGISKLQCQADIKEAPKESPCVITTGKGHLPGVDLLFSVSSSALTTGHKDDIDAFVKSWVASGSKNDVIVDGWASVDGPQPFNWKLSCDRAEAVKAELIRRGVPAKMITTFVHGESTEFSSTDLTKNRRAIITTLPAVKTLPTPSTPTQPLPPMTPKPALPYDPSYAPSSKNCEIYQSPLAETWFTFSYRHNATCACEKTPNEPHNNCVRKCLQVKMKAHLAYLSKSGAALPLTFPGEADPMCHDMWEQHVECYKECGCPNGFINYPTFSTMCRMPFPCLFVGKSIDWFNSCL